MTTDDTIFRTLSLDRSKVQWESYLDELTPVQTGDSGLRYKREDWFAPLGYGGINGAKLRQCIWLLRRASREGYDGVLSAGSVKSPQHAMVAMIAKHYGMRSYHVLGATKPTTASKHDSVAIAQAFGAEFEYIKVGYNAALQARVKSLATASLWYDDGLSGRWYQLEYAISLDHTTRPASEILEFHNVGAQQVANIPTDIGAVLMPAGSMNSACSVILGLARDWRAHPLDIHLIGIGHDRFGWLIPRLRAMGIKMTSEYILGPNGIRHWWTYHDLVGREFTDYQQMWKEEMDGIKGHPTYEAKCFRYLRMEEPSLLKPSSLFWVVGSEPKLAPMMTRLRGEEATTCNQADTVR